VRSLRELRYLRRQLPDTLSVSPPAHADLNRNGSLSTVSFRSLDAHYRIHLLISADTIRTHFGHENIPLCPTRYHKSNSQDRLISGD
jgi:hypothetical protein